MANIKAQIDKVLKDKVESAFLAGVGEVARNMHRVLTIEAAKPNSPIGSPIWSGRFIGSHRVALNQPDTSALPAGPIGKRNVYGPPNTSQLESVLAAMEMGDTVIFSNSVPHAKGVEAGIFSPKTPRGVYGVAAEYIKAYYKAFKVGIGRGK